MSAVAFYVACGSDGDNAGGSGDAGAGSDGSGNVGADAATDAGDPRCGTQAVLLGTHPHASQQTTTLGKNISDVRGFHGTLYFAYGDLEVNTGPIYITTFDPKTKAWTEHTVAYHEGDGGVSNNPAFATHDIERFNVIGDQLWATAAQPDYRAPYNASSAPEYAFGTANHDWTQVDMSPTGLHIISAIERAPNDIYLTGSAQMVTDASALANGRYGGFIWRSQDGGPWTQFYPDFSYPGGGEFFDVEGYPAFGGALNGTAYFDTANFIYKWDGKMLGFQEEFGEFLVPTPFAGNLLFADLGQLYAFDGAKRVNLNFRFFESQGRYQGLKEPLALFQATEGRLLAVKYPGDVMMTTDLMKWSCIGKVPADATSIGSLDGVVYFGSANAQVYGFPTASF